MRGRRRRGRRESTENKGKMSERRRRGQSE